VQRMLLHLGIKDVQLKWPNDVLVAGRKLSGVLVEVVSNAVGPCHTVIGVGLNVHMQQKKNSPWVSLAQLYLEPLSRNKIVAMLITELRRAIAQLQREGFEGFLEEWHMTDALRGHRIEVQTPQGKFNAKALGISDDGALHIKANGQEDFLRGAVVRVRKHAMVAA
jgi:BirA family biotin operon repressor/biotin-[acetyl-CoA-carboxylase] ligase